MRLNEGEFVSALAWQTPEWEGKLTYRPPTTSSGGGGIPFGRSSSDFKDRWFRLKSNFLFYWRVSPHNGGRPLRGSEPAGVLLLEGGRFAQEKFPESVHAFSLVFDATNPSSSQYQHQQRGQKHLFLANSADDVADCLGALREARYEAQRERLLSLQVRLLDRTGRDPLLGTVFKDNPVYDCRRRIQVARSALPEFATGRETTSPRARPRSNKGAVKSSFQSHLVESWEKHTPSGQSQGDEADANFFPAVAERKASFQSHLDKAANTNAEETRSGNNALW